MASSGVKSFTGVPSHSFLWMNLLDENFSSGTALTIYKKQQQECKENWRRFVTGKENWRRFVTGKEYSGDALTLSYLSSVIPAFASSNHEKINSIVHAIICNTHVCITPLDD